MQGLWQDEYMTKVAMSKKPWILGQLIGQGGFGGVYEAISEDGTDVGVIKLVPKVPGADRELLFENLAGTPNVIPIFDTGETSTDWAILMPRADTSLDKYIANKGGQVAPPEVVEILKDVANALANLDGQVIHRDLKPQNVLLYEKKWCLADFGIARYANEATDPNTRKFALTAAYAAPERWRLERATAASDIYSLGVMAHELLAGNLPFQGPDFRDQHLHKTTPKLLNAPSQLQSLVFDCLYKAPGARPNAKNILQRLSNALIVSSAASNKLQGANAVIAAKQAAESATASAAQSEAERRTELFGIAQSQLSRIVSELKEKIVIDAPTARFGNKGLIEVQFGDATLLIENIQNVRSGTTPSISGMTPLDVIAFTTIKVQQSKENYGYIGRHHSIWYGDWSQKNEYRWLELAFMFNPMMNHARRNVEPFSLNPGQDSYLALSKIMHIYQLARQKRLIDQGEEQSFFDRWMSWFASASLSNLGTPSRLPETE